MALELKQNLRLTQQLVMTPQLQQAIKLLQLSRLEMIDAITEELVQNPMLEESEGEEVEGERAEGEGGDAEAAGDRGEPDGEVSDGADADAYDAGDRAGEEGGGLDGETGDYQDFTEGSLKGEIPESGEGPASADNAEQVPDSASEDSTRKTDDIDWESYLDNASLLRTAPSSRESNEDLPSYESLLTRPETLFDHLVEQLRLTDLSEEDCEIGALIIGNLNDDGYLVDDEGEDLMARIAQERGVPVERVESVLMRVQVLDPVGVAARSLSECLCVQARARGIEDPLVYEVIRDHLRNLELRNVQAIARETHEEPEEIIEVVKVITTLDPKPGRQFTGEEPRYITPDIYVHKVGDRYVIVLNEDGMPKLKISNFYKQAVQAARKGGTKDYVQERLRSAVWLIRSIYQRQRTIYKVTESIVRFQREFFDRGIAHLKPLILRDVADDIGMHESTISRVTTNKYVHTPQGIFELKYFFNSGIGRVNGEDVASEAVKKRIEQIVAAEDGEHPLSDQHIAQMLRRENITIARRTVAKYRELMGILPSGKRKRLY